MNLDDLPDEQCGWCKKGYTPRAHNQKYCSTECRHASASAFDKQWRRAAMDALKCQHCGGPIVGAKKRSTRYCCLHCQTAARTVRERGPLEAKCIDCGQPVPGVIRRDTLRCPNCVRAARRARNRERARARRASLAALGPHASPKEDRP